MPYDPLFFLLAKQVKVTGMEKSIDLTCFCHKSLNFLLRRCSKILDIEMLSFCNLVVSLLSVQQVVYDLVCRNKTFQAALQVRRFAILEQVLTTI